MLLLLSCANRKDVRYRIRLLAHLRLLHPSLRPEQGEQAAQHTETKVAKHQAAPKVHLKCSRHGVPLS